MFYQRYAHLLATLTLFTTLFLSFGASDDDGSDTGIHCHTDRYCHGFAGGNAHPLGILEIAINETDPTRQFKNGENVACYPGGTGNGIDGAICAWVWNTDNTTTGAHIIVVAQTLLHHCTLCGSAPLNQSANDITTGELTFGWSWNEEGCDGKCNLWGGSTYEPGDIVPTANWGLYAPP